MSRRQSEARPRMRTTRAAVLVLAIAALLAGASRLDAGGTAAGTHGAISTASPIATRAGLGVLQKGGNAADAAVAVAFALAVVYPQAGNLGGGGFLTYYDAKSGGVWTLDFRETSPRSVTADAFAGNPEIARTGAAAAGVPGTVAGLAALHERFGTASWSELLAPAVALAHEELPVDSELAADLAAAQRERNVGRFEATAALFYDAGQPRAKIRNPELAALLERIRQSGAKEFYEGDAARTLVQAVRAAGGFIGYRDLAEYEPVWRAPIRIRYGPHDLYTVAPPASGGILLGEMLNILSGDDLTALGWQTPRAVHLLVEAQRRASIDCNRYLADPLSGRIPYRELLSAKRAEAWRKTIDPARVIATSSLAEPSDPALEGEHTTHFAIADAQGNVASVTTTLGENFGSGFTVPGLGILLNNAMDDFTTAKGRPNREGLVRGIANKLDPSRRPASSLAPTIVLRDGKPFLALGTSGGSTIPGTVLQVFLNIVAYGRSLSDAIAAPRYHHQGVPEEMRFETGRAPKETVDALSAMGHGLEGRSAIGDVHAILFEGQRMTAAADPRRGGAAGAF